MYRLIVLGVAALAVSAAAWAHSIADVFDRVSSSVVELAVAQREPVGTGEEGFVSSASLGSGFVIAEDGSIMTAAHVVQTADRVVVRYTTGETSPATVIASNPAADVALIRAERVPDDVAAAPLGDSDAVRVGDQVLVVGAPLGIAHSLTVGYVSGRRLMPSMLSGFESTELLQTDAAINSGNSGGPMFDLEGQVIGVVSHILSRSGGSEGIGFVVTSNLARRLLLDEPTPWSGMEALPVGGELARLLNVPGGAGALVQRIAEGSPAAALGLRAGTAPAVIGGEELLLGGDLILAIQGITLDSDDNLARIRAALRGLGPDQELVLDILRDGELTQLRRTGSALRGER